MKCAVGLVRCREPVCVAIVGVKDGTSGPFVRALRFQPPDNRLAALSRSPGRISDPDNPAADRALAVENIEDEIPDHPGAVDVRRFCLSDVH